MTAPSFCMLLRKYIANGRILSVTQPSLERSLVITIEHLDEMRYPAKKLLIAEMMGKHSNLIFCDESGRILDAIRHVSSAVSSVREVLPGRTYFLPDTQQKLDPLSLTEAAFSEKLTGAPAALSKSLYTSFTGISPIVAEEICFRSGADPVIPYTEQTDEKKAAVFAAFMSMMDDVRTAAFSPCIYYDDADRDSPRELSALPLSLYSDLEKASFASISEAIVRFYREKALLSRIRQKSSDLRHVVHTALERAKKKQLLQRTQLDDTANRDKYRLYGELLQAYGHTVEAGAKEAHVNNYYTNEEIVIPLDPAKTAQENAVRFYERYNKQKRTNEALTAQLEDTASEIAYLESVSLALDLARDPGDLADIRSELLLAGVIRKVQKKKKAPDKSEPLHYVSSDGTDLYVGKNNLQNEYLTFRLADGGDWWFHAKGIPGSHVIAKTNGRELSDTAFEEAARLAAHYSAAANDAKAEVDYVQKKHIKKPAKARPGYVIYHTNYSMQASTDISGIRLYTQS